MTNSLQKSPNLFLTKVDKKLLPKLLEYLKIELFIEEDLDMSSVNNYPVIIEYLKKADQKLGNRICTDLPNEIINSLTPKEWKFFMVEFCYYNNDYSDLFNTDMLPQNFILFSFYAIKLQALYLKHEE